MLLRPLIFILVVFAGISACHSSVEKKLVPIQFKDQPACFNALSALTKASTVSMGLSAHSHEDHREKAGIEVRLTNGDLPFLSAVQLDSVSQLIAITALQHVQNLAMYDSITVITQSHLGNQVMPPKQLSSHTYLIGAMAKRSPKALQP